MELTYDQREGLIELLAQRYLEVQTQKSLEDFYLEVTADSLSSYADFELIEALEDMSPEAEFKELIGEIANA